MDSIESLEFEEAFTDSLKLIAKSGFVFIIVTLIAKLIAYAVRLVVARQGTATYGAFSIGIMVLSIFLTIASAGFSYGAYRFIPEFEEKKQFKKSRRVGLMITLFTTVISILAGAVMFIASPFFADIFHIPYAVIMFQVFAISIPFNCIGGIFAAIMRSIKKYKYEAGIKLFFENIVRIFFVFFAAWFGFGLIGISIGYALPMALSMILIGYFVLKYFNFLKVKPNLKESKEVVKYSIPLFISGSVSLVIGWFDVLIIGLLLKTSEVGIYSAAMPTASMLTVIPAIASLEIPLLTTLKTKNRKNEFNGIFVKMSKWIFYVTFPLFIFLLFFSSEILNVFFGSAYTTGALVLILGSIGYMISSIATPANDVLSVFKKTNWILYDAIVSSVLMVVLVLVLVPVIGMTGGAIATSAALTLNSALLWIQARKISKENPLKLNYLKSVIASVLAGLIAFGFYEIRGGLVISFFISIAIFGLIYIAMLFLLNSFDKFDQKILKLVIAKTGVKQAIEKWL